MPFIEQKKRARFLSGWFKASEPGDLCFLEYHALMEKWKKERRWKTAHKALRDMFGFSDEQTAKVLAFAVFFVKHVMDYENEKIKENGDIL